MVEMIFIAMVYETVLVAVSVILLIFSLMKYFERKHELTLYLFFVFLFFTLAILFSWISKVLVIYSDLQYIKNLYSPSDPGTLESWFVLRIIDFRFSFIFTTIAIFFSYLFKVKIFHDDFNPKHKIFVIIFGLISVLYNLLIYQAGNQVLMAIAFLLPFIYMFMIYFPFMRESFHSFFKVEDAIYKRAFFSLIVMCICFMLIFLFFTIDRVLIIVGFPRFTIFYFLAWATTIIGMFGAYLGYIRPKSKEV